MKLEELTIDGSYFGHSDELGVYSQSKTAYEQLTLGRFANGLTFVYGENASGKSTALRLYRQALADIHSNEERVPGELVVSNQGRSIRINNLDNVTDTLQQDLIANRVTFDVFNSVFAVSFKQTPANSLRLARVLQTELGVGIGPVFAGDNSVYLARQKELESARSRMHALQQQIAALQSKRSELIRANQEDSNQLQSRLSRLDAEISATENRISQLTTSPLIDRLNKLDADIQSLRLRIESAKPEVSYPTVQPASDLIATLYRRLDEIENQIHRWRHLQMDIQNQRVRLRDEMLIWNDLTLDSDQHPYHAAREILVGLEAKVDETERNAQHWATAGGARVDANQVAKTLGQLCQSMRDDVYGLCNELSHQFKYLRHKSAASELKQLRRCYSEMGENLERLVRHRSSVLREIRDIDPAGADAIVRGESDFCQCARHEGYLEARKRFVGGTLTQPQPEIVNPDLTQERIRLAELNRNRSQLVDQIHLLEQESNELRQQLAILEGQRESLIQQIKLADANNIAPLDEEINQLYAQLNGLKERTDLTLVQATPHPVLQTASEYLRNVTNNSLIRVFLEQAANLEPCVVVHDHRNVAVSFDQLEPDRQDQVYLSLLLAAKEQLALRGVILPTMIDDAFCRIAGERINPTLDLVNSVCQRGHQIVVMTQHRYLADRAPGVTVLSLERTTSPSPSRATPIAPRVIQSGDNEWARHNQYDDVFMESAVPRPYPLSKYSRIEPNDHLFEDAGSTVSQDPNYPPNSTTEFVSPRIFPPITHRARSRQTERYSTVSVDSVGQPMELAASISETSLLESTGLFEPGQLRRFTDLGLTSVESLLALDPSEERHGLSADQVDRWQSQLWLLLHVPTLRPEDACALVACGITEPSQLATSHAQQLFERLSRFLETTRARSTRWSNLTIDAGRIRGWLNSLERTRSRWQNRSRTRDRRGFAPRSYQSSGSDRTQTRRALDQRRERDSRQPMQPRPPRMHSRSVSDNDRSESSRPSSTRHSEPSTKSRTSGESSTTSSSRRKPRTQRQTRSENKVSKPLKFYLELDDHIEAAPSIGPKTSERFEKIGVVTVADFLKQTAESMATKLNYKRLNADLIRQWQHQARLVCRIPNLRGHDAQLLVACEFIEPEALATMQPQKLLDVIGPFSDTKEGLKIIRNGKKPDLEEITDWITWAGDTRSLQAA
ncbi:MAG: DUF4332 domain-containing protein [Planctomycetota bacterium]